MNEETHNLPMGPYRVLDLTDEKGYFCGKILRRRAPLIGEHNREVYEQELGCSAQVIAAFKQAGVI